MHLHLLFLTGNWTHLCKIEKQQRTRPYRRIPITISLCFKSVQFLSEKKSLSNANILNFYFILISLIFSIITLLRYHYNPFLPLSPKHIPRIGIRNYIFARYRLATKNNKALYHIAKLSDIARPVYLL